MAGGGQMRPMGGAMQTPLRGTSIALAPVQQFTAGDGLAGARVPMGSAMADARASGITGIASGDQRMKPLTPSFDNNSPMQ